MSNIQDYKKFILEWNNMFPCDRIYRKKYNIPFGSEQHLKTCQINIYLDYLENKLHDEFYQEAKQGYEDEQEVKKGIWIKPQEVSEEESDELFEKIRKIDFNKLNIKIED